MARLDEFKRRIEALEARRLYARVKPPGPEATDYQRTLYAIVSNARNTGRTVTMEWAQDKAKAILAALAAMEAMDSRVSGE